ncbi:MAG: hypothetical protein FJW36_20050 [Acidobacteria bacterium]|nr:hypothetical protein [Acidobacteriota bacterium]
MSQGAVHQNRGAGDSLFQSEWLVVRFTARLIGLTFGWLDLLAYFMGIGFVYWLDEGTKR